MQTLTSSPWPALASGAHLEQQSPGSCPRERLRCISAGRNPSQPHSRTLTQPSPLGNDLIPFPHRSSVALQTIWFSLKPVHNVWANSKGHMTAFILQKLPVLVLETGAAHDSLHLTKTSHSGDRNRGWGLFCCLRAPNTGGMQETPVAVLGWWGGHRVLGDSGGHRELRSPCLLLPCATNHDPSHQSWAGFRKPRGSTKGIKWGCMIRILIKGKILEICHIRNAMTINSDNTTLGK